MLAVVVLRSKSSADSRGRIEPGDATACFVVFALPTIAHGAISEELKLTARGSLNVLVLPLSVGVVAGVIAQVPHLATKGAAIGFGFGIDTVIKSVFSAGRKALSELT